jgi:hypothetical protein
MPTRSLLLLATSSLTSLALHFSSKEAIVDWVAAKGYTTSRTSTAATEIQSLFVK